MTSHLFILNDAPYGSERSYNALRLAGTLAMRESEEVRVFLLGDAVACAKSGQKVPPGYYNIAQMLPRIIRSGRVVVCGSCLDARGISESELVEGAQRSTMEELANWTSEVQKVLVF